MRINHNIQALNAYRNLAVNQSNTAKNLEKLSSGLRINRAADDAAGLAISEKMRSQIRGLEVAERNALDAISLIQTAEGALGSMHSMLQRMRELAIQAANGTNQPEDLDAIQAEITQLKHELTRIGTHTEYNAKKLLDGSKGAKTTSAKLTAGQATTVSAANPISIKDGAETKNNTITVTIKDTVSTNPQIEAGVDLTLNIKEGSYSDLVSFTKAFNDALQQAAIDLKNSGGADVTALVAKYSLGFDVNSSNGKVQFQLRTTSTTTTESLTVQNEGVSAELAKALGLNATDISVSGAASGNSTNFTNVSKDASGNDFLWNQFSIDLVDGLNPEVNQNNQLSLTVDGLKVDAYIAEGNYTSESTLASAVKSAIIGINPANAAYTNVMTTPNATNWNALVTAAGGASATGIIKAVNDLTASDLNAKGYNGNLDDMKAAYFKDLMSKAGTNFDVSFTADHKLQINGPAEMKVDETSKGAIAIGMTNVNADIKNSGIYIQIGANDGQIFMVDIGDFRAQSLGKTDIQGQEYYVSDINVTTSEGAQNAIKILDIAIQQVSAERSKLGAYQNRLEHTINNLKTAHENLTSAESRIRDTDMAMEMTNFTKNNILNQAAQAMLAQSNQLPQGILQLLKS